MLKQKKEFHFDFIYFLFYTMFKEGNTISCIN